MVAAVSGFNVYASTNQNVEHLLQLSIILIIISKTFFSGMNSDIIEAKLETTQLNKNKFNNIII